MIRIKYRLIGYMVLLLLMGCVFGGIVPSYAEDAAAAGAKGQTFWGLISAGGIWMWPIMLGSVAMVALTIEHIVSLQFKKVVPQKLISDVHEHLKGNRLEDVKNLVEGRQDSVSRIVQAGLEKAGHGREVITEIVADIGSREVLAMNRKISWLSIIAVIEPMLGLLGTVTGMISAFNVIAAGGAGKPALLAKGVSEALITTAAGLIVGIPAMILHFIFKNKVQRLTVAIETFATDFVDLLSRSEKK